ncbi:MAG: type I restriction-modification system subunit M [Desulfuromonadales bacterium]|nr:type I restriction-modification system subunit M [Desulfuromonadales bacterium]
MAIKKSELYSSLWKSCDELRGGMDASQYKDYILTLLFVKYVSDKYAGDRNALIVVPEGGSFGDMVKLKGDKEIGDKINKIIGRLSEENDLKGVIDVADFNNEDQLGKGKEMVDRLSKLVTIFDGMDLRANRAEGDDLLGDAYEYLMRNFATESGKSKGQFYTPAEVSRILAKVIGINRNTRQDQTVYDPTCGSGSLLLKAADEAPRGMSIFGQEMDNATAALARMNMILHDSTTAEIWKDNTLSTPHFKEKDGSLKTFDYAVANPPFSTKAWSNGFDPAHDEYKRFEYGIPPAKNGDYAFLLHIIKSLKSTGKGAVILPHGVLFRGNAEAVIRKNLIRRGLIKGIIGLPANLFYGTGIPACIIVVDKEHAQARKGIFMIDASRGFMKDGNKNRLRSQDLHKVVDIFNKQLELPRYSRMVPLAEIEGNDFNLNIPRYIDASEDEDLHDLDAHLNGGIPNRDVDALSRYWQVLPGLRDTLFEPARDDYCNAKVEAHEVKSTILNHPEFSAFAERVQTIFADWRAAHLDNLRALKVGDDPKQIIFDISEDLLNRFAKAELVDKYDVYQHLMDYWAETMQDGVFVLVQDGWLESAKLRLIVDVKGEKSKESPDLVVNKKKYKADLIPPELIVSRYFSAERKAVDDLEAAKDEISRGLEEFIEEHSGEGSLLEDAKTDKGKVTKASLKTRMVEVKGQPDSKEELAVLNRCQKLLDREAAADKQVKEAQQALEEKVLAKYPQLSEAEVKALVVEDKWLASVEADIREEVDRVTQTLTGRVKTLEERYEKPLPVLNDEMMELAMRVDNHLKNMGLAWK